MSENLTTAQAAQRAGVSRYVLNRAKKAGNLNPIRDNRGALLWDAGEIDRWAGERAQGAHTVPGDDIAQLRTALADAESRATDAERRAAVAEALADERAERIADLRRMLPEPGRPARLWPWGRKS